MHGSKAVLKPPQSKRYREYPASLNFAKRLDCGAFTAAFQHRSHEFPLIEFALIREIRVKKFVFHPRFFRG
jgi:hypothetical protein